MKLFKISQDVNNDYDTFDEAIVCAESEEEAKKIHPGGGELYGDWDGKKEQNGCWCAIEDVKVEYIGEAGPDMKSGVVCASFNAG